MSERPPLVDLHCHFVPGVDDGAPTLEDALHYLRQLVAAGVTTVCTTPHLPAHHASGPRRREIEGAFETLRSAAREELPELSLRLAYEIRLDDPDVELDLPGLCLGDGNRVLVEFPMFSLPAYPDVMLEVVIEQGLVPVLAHPERYFGLERAYGWVEKWREAGALMCVTAGSLWGEYGPDPERLSRRMLALGDADLLGSDHHARPQRASTLGHAWDLLTEAGAEEQARLLLSLNPIAVLEGRETSPVPPVSLAEGWLGRLRRMVRGGAP